jgi:hypothetical protein
MSHRRIKRKPLPPLNEHAFDAIPVITELKSVARADRIRFALAALSDEFLKEANCDYDSRDIELTVSIVAITVQATVPDGQKYSPPLTDGKLADLVSRMEVLLTMEELRRRGLVRIEGGYPDSLDEESKFSVQKDPDPDEYTLSPRARKFLAVGRAGRIEANA